MHLVSARDTHVRHAKPGRLRGDVLVRWSSTAAACILVAATPCRGAATDYPWPHGEDGRASLEDRIPPPPGYQRLPAAEGSFAGWLRRLPLRKPEVLVRLFDGRLKANQGAHAAVVDIDVGSRDLQQCADAVIRLRAEYLFAAGCGDAVAFDFTSGHRARCPDWRAGQRPVVSGATVSWVLRGAPDPSYASFRAYLDAVFTYAGSSSLGRELQAVPDASAVLPGDVFIQGGFPGHAVLVADVTEDARGRRAFLLLQSYMPAQDIHVLRNPSQADSPWYPALRRGPLATPEWTFAYSDLRRFVEPDCRAGPMDEAPSGGGEPPRPTR